MSSILVIGGAGYIGSHAVKALKDRGRGVVVLDNLSTGHRTLLDPRVDLFVEGDLSDGLLLERIFSGNRIEVVMHFAAHSMEGRSI